ncbi:nitrite reductase [Nocardioides daejeonensis]|uniref:nitrite reductase n=1 Tax=Nocardioides daejeonensis TaxID=1046556 RepID=UPI0013A5AFAA|nr:nitrite reductase [Nocardioides daejeonensis]
MPGSPANDAAPGSLSRTRTRGDLCPGVLRPWLADDGALVRLRLVGGATRIDQLAALGAVAEKYGSGTVHLTKRANLQVRGLPVVGDGCPSASLPHEVVAAIEATGLLPSHSHELVRNILLSPLSGVTGGRADLRPLAERLDRALRATPAAAGLSARFLFVLDDGRGDVVGRSADLGVIALDERTAQVRVGSAQWSEPLALDDVVPALVGWATAFVAARGTGPDAPWHVDELPTPLLAHAAQPDPRLPEPTAPPAYGALPGCVHRQVPDGRLAPRDLAALAAEFGSHRRIVVTPWRSLVIPDA